MTYYWRIEKLNGDIVDPNLWASLDEAIARAHRIYFLGECFIRKIKV
jgi:hypothetical protein